MQVGKSVADGVKRNIAIFPSQHIAQKVAFQPLNGGHGKAFGAAQPASDAERFGGLDHFCIAVGAEKITFGVKPQNRDGTIGDAKLADKAALRFVREAMDGIFGEVAYVRNKLLEHSPTGWFIAKDPQRRQGLVIWKNPNPCGNFAKVKSTGAERACGSAADLA
jgi:hypothetical protein